MSQDPFIEALGALIQGRWQQIAASTAAVGFSAEPLMPFALSFGAPCLDRLSICATADRKRVSVCTRAQRGDALRRLDGLVGEDGWSYPASVSELLHEVISELVPAEVEVRATLSHQYARPELAVDLYGLWGRGMVRPVLQRVAPASMAGFDDAVVYLGVLEVRVLRLVFNPVTGQPTVGVWFHRLYPREQSAGVGAEHDAVAEHLGASARQRTFLRRLHDHLTPRPENDNPVALWLGPDELLHRVDTTYRAIPTRLVLGVLQGISPFEDDGELLGTVAGALLSEAPGCERVVLTAWDREPPGVEWEILAPSVVVPG